ncbi:MAG: flagellar hook protein FlgE [Nitrospina sp.]|jgi:flagellar hook protein FlgE|nr:flagellar hook protein FlgE [Nitrospina sp.]
MSLISTLFTGVSGLSGQSKAMEIIGDNIANVNTVGFKGSAPVFGDIFSTVLHNGAVTSQLGGGSQLSGVLQAWDQGAIEHSPNALDLAIDGNGFFVTSTYGDTDQFYTRNGQFRINELGLVQSMTGEILKGFDYTNDVLSTTMEDIDLAGVQSSPNASTYFNSGTQLNAAATATSTFITPVTLYNSVGSIVTLNVTFTKVASANQWSYSAIPSEGTITAGATGTVTFDTTGQLSLVDGETAADHTFTLNFDDATTPANEMSLNWDLVDSAGTTHGKLTGFAAASNNNSLVQDGYATGTLLGLSVTSLGDITGLFNNGQTELLNRIAMADFLAPSGLNRSGNNKFTESQESGAPTIGVPDTGGLGKILGESLELSNVDIAQAFVTMIKTQQAYQASARLITTTDDLLSESVNLVR